MKTITFICGLLFSTVLSAQEFPRFSFDVGGGFTQTVGNTGRELDNGWNINGGAGFNFNSRLGANVNVGFNDLGITSTTANNLGFPGGDVHIFSATLDPIVHLTPHSRFDVYVTGGGGMFRTTQQFNAPAPGAVTGFNPFFGFFQSQVPTNQVVSSYTVIKPGIDAGAGIAFGTKWHGKIFAEARYNRIFMDYGHYDYVPVSFGFRF
jgi:Outer membrane protein beta-barrel domain